MKSIIKSSLLLCAGVALFSACDKDLDNNPVLQSPKTFVLNTPAYAAQTIDLKIAESLKFTWSQPEYGFPVAAEYGMQFSTTNTWTKSVDAVVDMDAERGNYAVCWFANRYTLLPLFLQRPCNGYSEDWNAMRRLLSLQHRNSTHVFTR